MRLETRIEVLQNLSLDAWDVVLENTLHQPHPGYFIVVPEVHAPELRPWLPIDPDDLRALRTRAAKNQPKIASNRRAHILARLAAGARKCDIAKELEVSPGLISKILKGERR